MGEHSFRTRSCWCDSARAQGLQKQTWRWYSDHFVLNARSIVAIFLRNWTQCVDGFSLLWQRYVRKGNAAKNPAILGFFQSRSQRPRSFWLATGIATSGQVQLRKSAIHGLCCHSAHAQSQVWQIGLVLVSIYCVYKTIQNQNVVGHGQWSRFSAHDRRDPWGRGWDFSISKEPSKEPS